MAETNTSNPLQALPLHRQVGVVASGALAVLCFMPWFKIKAPMISQSVSATDGWQGIVCLILAGAAAVLFFSGGLRSSTQAKLPPGARKFLLLGLAGVATLIGPVWFLLDSSGVGTSDVPAEARELFSKMVEVGRTFWSWLALLAGVAATWAGWQESQQTSN